MGTTISRLRSDGDLLDDYLEEADAAAAIGVKPVTLVKYRKQRIGPVHTEVGRRILYARTALAEWLARGGTRGGAT